MRSDLAMVSWWSNLVLQKLTSGLRSVGVDCWGLDSGPDLSRELLLRKPKRFA